MAQEPTGEGLSKQTLITPEEPGKFDLDKTHTLSRRTLLKGAGVTGFVGMAAGILGRNRVVNAIRPLQETTKQEEYNTEIDPHILFNTSENPVVRENRDLLAKDTAGSIKVILEEMLGSQGYLKSDLTQLNAETIRKHLHSGALQISHYTNSFFPNIRVADSIRSFQLHSNLLPQSFSKFYDTENGSPLWSFGIDELSEVERDGTSLPNELVAYGFCAPFQNVRGKSADSDASFLITEGDVAIQSLIPDLKINDVTFWSYRDDEGSVQVTKDQIKRDEALGQTMVRVAGHRDTKDSPSDSRQGLDMVIELTQNGILNCAATRRQ